MSLEGAACMAAAFRSIGVDARPAPDATTATFSLAKKYLSGDECLPEAVTLGSLLQITIEPGYDPAKTAIMLPTSNGPCRFGHYLPLARKVFQQRGESEVLLFSPSSTDGYKDIGEHARDLVRTGWRAVVASDAVRKMVLKTRPYEINPGATDAVYRRSLDHICAAIATQQISHGKRLQLMIQALQKSRNEFNSIPQNRNENRLLIGIVGEIFCRLDEFSNDHVIRMVEKYGGEAWMSDVSEWVWYTNDEAEKRLSRFGQRYSFNMLGAKIKHAVMAYDEHALLKPFFDDFKKLPEPDHITKILDRSRPYLPREGAHGEMVISVGKAIWYSEHGAAGVIDISPFTCMNAIVCEAVYPRVSRDLNGFPIRVFYFDGLKSKIENDVEIFLELTRNFKK
jgi:predicted nucleotide-binding protein (sugar kinase/HSP70/actin superfamily)